jgi:hypothetical protein
MHVPSRSFSSPRDNRSKVMILVVGGLTPVSSAFTRLNFLHTTIPLYLQNYTILALQNEQLDPSLAFGNPRHDVMYTVKAIREWLTRVYVPLFGEWPEIHMWAVSEGANLAAYLIRYIPVRTLTAKIELAKNQPFPPRDSFSFQNTLPQQMLDELSINHQKAVWFWFHICAPNNVDREQYRRYQVWCPRVSSHVRLSNFSSSTSSMVVGPLFPFPPTTYLIHVDNNQLSDRTLELQWIRRLKQQGRRMGGILYTSKYFEQAVQSIKMQDHSNNTAQFVQMLRAYLPAWSHHKYPNVIESFVTIYHASLRYSTQSTRLQLTTWSACVEDSHLFPFVKFCSSPVGFLQCRSLSSLVDIPLMYYQLFVSELTDLAVRYDITAFICEGIHAIHETTTNGPQQQQEWRERIHTMGTEIRKQRIVDNPIQVYIYPQNLISPSNHYFNHTSPTVANCGLQNLYPGQSMYNVGSFLSDFFSLLSTVPNRTFYQFRTTSNPLLATYYFIPSMFPCLFFDRWIGSTGSRNFTALAEVLPILNQFYMQPLLDNIRHKFPFWNFSAGADHLIPFTIGVAMALTTETIQRTLQHCIQLTFSGVLQSQVEQFYGTHRRMYVNFLNVTAVFREGYDIVIPPYSPTQHHSHTDMVFKFINCFAAYNAPVKSVTQFQCILCVL